MVNILLVDDRPNNLMSLKALLQRPDYNLVLASSGPEALALVLRQDFAVILLDVAMPKMDGFETAAIIKEREQSKLTPILFVTASVYDMEHVFRGYTVGAVDFLRKPIDPHAVRAKVAVFVELFRQRKQIEAQSRLLQQAEVRLRQRAEASLQQSEALYQATFEEAPVGIAHATPEGRITRANRRLSTIMGCEPEALIGRRLESLAEPGERAAMAERIAALQAGEPLYVGEHRLSTERETTIWAALRLSALRDDDGGKLRQLIVVVEDISERKLLELERSRLVLDLQDGIRTRDDFLAVAAHELKTPITPLRLQAAGLVRDLADGAKNMAREELLRRVRAIDKASSRLGALVERLLDESQQSVGKLSLELQNTELGSLVRDAVSRVKEEAERTGSRVFLTIGEPVHGRWDPLRLDQVVSNLLSNAIKYGAGQPIEVKVTHEDDVARLTVRDHGLGIPQESRERIFERFERVAPLRHFGGFGLGLWIVRRVVEAHGGHVTVWSNPNQGSEFIVELPMQPHVSRASRAPHPAQLEAHP
jgi:PAS domain S-box-containing protein